MRPSKPWPLFVVLALATGGAGLAQDADAGARLREAATRGDVAQVGALLDAGADVNAASEYGATALSFAADKGHVEVVRLLLARGARTDVKDTFYGSTPAGWAGYKGHGEVLKLLAQAGADVTSAVGGAVSTGKPEAIKPLLEAKLLNPRQLTLALNAAQAGKNAELVALLEAAGAQPLPPANAKVDLAVLATYVGSYEHPSGMRISISISANQTLQVSFGERPPMELAAENDVRFRLRQYEALSLTFESEGGAVRRVLSDDSGETMTLERTGVPAPTPAPAPALTPAPKTEDTP